MSKTRIILGLFAVISFLFPQTINAQTNPNANVEGAVRFYFADVPIMIDIAKCETGYRQYNSDGTALHDPTGTYVGVFQIAEKLHDPRATSMGYDVRTLDGNLMYARYLYNSSGTNPWKGCLPKTVSAVMPPPVTNLAVVSGSITVNLRMGMSSTQVRALQQILNNNGFVITQTGPGSLGNETNYFGSMTREALRRFQCAKGIVCNGDEATTGYGRVGPKTRSILNSL
jgi:hypothetical protein